MGVRIWLAAAAASLLLVVPAQAAKPCTFRGARTVIQNSKVRIYKQLSKDHVVLKYYGCVKRTNKTFKFDAIEAEEGRVYDVQLHGYIVGYAMYYTDATGDSSQGYVASYDVKRRALLIKGDGASDTSGYYGVDRMLMTRDGSMAWMGWSRHDANDPMEEVHIAYGGYENIVDSGTDIDPRSLTLSGRTVSWRRGGVTKTATIGA